MYYLHTEFSYEQTAYVQKQQWIEEINLRIYWTRFLFQSIMTSSGTFDTVTSLVQSKQRCRWSSLRTRSRKSSALKENLSLPQILERENHILQECVDLCFQNIS